MKYKTVIWDWNGTLLNDIDICLNIINTMLNKRGIAELTIERYKQIFTFPVRDYYEKAGFDFGKESFDDLAVEFIEQYYSDLPKASLFSEVEKVLEFVQQKGIKQIVLSAMEQNALVASLKQFGIDHFFDEVLGIEDHHGGGKMHIARNYFNGNSRNKDEFVMIGDTYHDCEIAQNLNLDIIIIVNGHHSIHWFKNCDTRMICGTLGEIVDYI